MDIDVAIASSNAHYLCINHFYKYIIQTLNMNDLHSNPCTDTLTNIEYLDHMIPHHQVAIDMSHALQKTNITKPIIHT